MTARLAELTAAADAIAVTKWVSAACQRCGQRFAYVRPRGATTRVWCDACAEPGRREQKDAAKQRARQRKAGELPPPELPPMPSAPDWSRAFCQVAPAHMRPYWTSVIPAEREAAKHACRTRCPVQAECELWSLALPVNDSAVYAGLSQNERRRRRRAVWRSSPARRWRAGIAVSPPARFRPRRSHAQRSRAFGTPDESTHRPGLSEAQI